MGPRPHPSRPAAPARRPGAAHPEPPAANPRVDSYPGKHRGTARRRGEVGNHPPTPMVPLGPAHLAPSPPLPAPPHHHNLPLIVYMLWLFPAQHGRYKELHAGPGSLAPATTGRMPRAHSTIAVSRPISIATVLNKTHVACSYFRSGPVDPLTYHAAYVQ